MGNDTDRLQQLEDRGSDDEILSALGLQQDVFRELARQAEMDNLIGEGYPEALAEEVVNAMRNI